MKRPLELNVREDLLESEDIKSVDNVDSCPNIYVKIQGVETEAHIDTRSEITCLSESFFENNKNKFNPPLPNLKIVTPLPNPREIPSACQNICSVAKCCDYLFEHVTSKCGNTALKNSSYFPCTKAKL